MKKAFAWIGFGMLTLLACRLFSRAPIPSPQTVPPTEVEPAPHKPDVPVDDSFVTFREGLIESQHPLLDVLSGASMYVINFSIQEDLIHTDGIEEVHYTNREEVPLDEIHFRLLPNVLSGEMRVTSVRVDGQPFEPIYELEHSLMRVPLYQPLEPGQSVNLNVEFSVKVPTSLESNYGILAYYEDVLTLAHAYPMIAVYDDEGWNAEIPPAQGDPTYADASFFSVTVDAPEELVLVGSGVEIHREIDGSRQLVKFAAGPARDFYLAASPEYEVVSKTVGEVTFNSYAPNELQDGAELALDTAIQAFDFFGEQYTPYPYTEFDIVSTPTYALGIEYPGIVAITDNIYDLEGVSYGVSNSVMLESTVAHEAGHQWFYNLVGNDQLDEPWLDESLTQFVTWQYYIDRYSQNGASGWEQSLRGRWANVDSKPIPIGMPVAEYEGSTYSAIIYGRGAFFFEALREKMGEKNFDAFMKDYAVSNSWGIGTGGNLQEIAEEHCNCNLDRLYKEWIDP